MKKSRYLLTGVLIAGILTAGVLLVKKNNPPSVPLVTKGPDGKAKGPVEAPIQMVEYSDFQCPACAYAEPVIQKILTEFDGKIRFMYRHFPIGGHHRAALAHQAAECANSLGKFWEYHGKLYGEQSTWVQAEDATEVILRYAREVDLPVEQFALCLLNPEIHSKVIAERKSGEDLQVRSTPTFFINGERVVGTMELQNRGVELIKKTLGIQPSPSPETSPEAPPAASLSPA